MSLEQKNDWEKKIDIKSLELEELTEQLVQMGLPKFRGGQVYSWLHEKRVDSFEQMSNLSAALRQQLAQRYYINSLTIIKKLVSKIDGTQKYLLRLADNNCVEAVLISMEIRSASPRRSAAAWDANSAHPPWQDWCARCVLPRCSMKSTP